MLSDRDHWFRPLASIACDSKNLPPRAQLGITIVRGRYLGAFCGLPGGCVGSTEKTRAFARSGSGATSPRALLLITIAARRCTRDRGVNPQTTFIGHNKTTVTMLAVKPPRVGLQGNLEPTCQNINVELVLHHSRQTNTHKASSSDFQQLHSVEPDYVSASQIFVSPSRLSNRAREAGILG